MAGYSKRSLVNKLGIQPSYKVTFINHPKGYEKILGPLPEKVVVGLIEEGQFDFIQMFSTEKEELMALFPILKNHLKPAGMLWISWQKGSSNGKSDLNENLIRDIGLQNGLVDVKVIAVDETWSGLKFVFRLKDRK